MPLTKTDFLHYLNCPKSFWLSKREPDNFPEGEFSAFQEKLVREGQDVEDYFRQFFESAGNHNVGYQVTFESPRCLLARPDGLEVDGDGRVTLYEVKSSTSVKTDTKHNQLKDACFQKICAEQAGQRVDRVILVHLNGHYVRDGDIDPAELLVFADITDRVAEIEDETRQEIAAALELLAIDLDRNGCPCRRKTRSHHCDAFDYFNPEIQTPSIYSLPRITAQRLEELVDADIFDLADLGRDVELSNRQRLVVEAAQAGEPRISRENIRAFLDGLVFPLYFLDYETYASAVPLIDGTSPHRHFPVQYSLHIMDDEGRLAHREYLEREARLPDRLLDCLRADIGPEGSILSWHAAFERSRNTDMAEDFPAHEGFLADLNDRMVDLENPFKADYVDAGFDGSTSIKKVLPVICPGQNYDGLEVQDGASAMDAWKQMVEAPPEDADRIAENLLEYCKLDTFAMVEIYRFLRGVMD